VASSWSSTVDLSRYHIRTVSWRQTADWRLKIQGDDFMCYKCIAHQAEGVFYHEHDPYQNHGHIHILVNWTANVGPCGLSLQSEATFSKCTATQPYHNTVIIKMEAYIHSTYFLGTLSLPCFTNGTSQQIALWMKLLFRKFKYIIHIITQGYIFSSYLTTLKWLLSLNFCINREAESYSRF